MIFFPSTKTNQVRRVYIPIGNFFFFEQGEDQEQNILHL